MREMKDSGIEWIGLAPISWDYIAIKYLVKSRLGGSWGNDVVADNDEYNRVCMRIADFDFIKLKFKENGNYTIRRYSKQDIEAKTLCYGDLLIEKSGGGEKTPVGRVVVYRLSDENLYANFMERIRLNEKLCTFEFAKYFFYSLYSQGFTRFYYNQTTGIQNLNIERYFREIKVPLLPLNIQQQIADYLDTQCSEIDATDEDIQKEISLLEEYKKSLVYNVISNGINHSIYSTENDEVWGNLPQGWKLVDIKYLFEIVKRIAGKEGYDVLSVTQKGLKIKDITSGDGQLADNYCGYQFVYPTDYVMNHMDLLTGWVDCSELFGVTSPDYRVFRLIDRSAHNLVYYKYVMQCCYMNKIFYSLGQGVSNLGRWRLQTSSFNNFKVPVPPKDEQDEIADYLDIKCSEIDALIADKKRQRGILADYKKSLIYEYVTGKKEVPVHE